LFHAATVPEINPLQRFPLTGIARAFASRRNYAPVARDQLREIDAASSLVVLGPTLLARLPVLFTAGFVDARSRSELLSRLPVSPDDYDALSESSPPYFTASRLRCRVSSTLPGRREPRSARSTTRAKRLSRRSNRRSGVASSTAKPYSSCESVRTSRSCLRHAVDPLLGVHAPLKRSPPTPWTLSEDPLESSTPPDRPLRPLLREFPRELTLGRLARHATFGNPREPAPRRKPTPKDPPASRPPGPPRPAPPTPHCWVRLAADPPRPRAPGELPLLRKRRQNSHSSAAPQLVQLGLDPTTHRLSALRCRSVLLPWPSSTCSLPSYPGENRSKAIQSAQPAGPSKP
jgi:hypothetical protein